MALVTKGLAGGCSRELGHSADVPCLNRLDRLLFLAPYEVKLANALLLVAEGVKDARIGFHSS